MKKTDENIKEDLIEKLKWEPNVSETDIGVTVHDGIVTPTGTVPNFSEKHSAEQAALRVSGVRAVTEEIKVKLSGSIKKDDADISRDVSNSLQAHVSLPKDLKVTVEDGRVTLLGNVNYGYLRDLATSAVRYISGVRDIKKRIKESLHRIAEEDANKIVVEADGSKVTISGNVRSFAEMDDIKWAAWAAPGVSQVENKMCLSL